MTTAPINPFIPVGFRAKYGCNWLFLINNDTAKKEKHLFKYPFSCTCSNCYTMVAICESEYIRELRHAQAWDWERYIEDKKTNKDAKMRTFNTTDGADIRAYVYYKYRHEYPCDYS